MLLKRDVFEEIGAFCEEYFMYSEDLDVVTSPPAPGERTIIWEAPPLYFSGTSTLCAQQAAMNGRAELQFCNTNYGRFSRAFVRHGSDSNASAGLGLLAALGLLVRVFRVKHALDSAWLRSSVILKTLVTSSGTATEQSVSTMA